jgi:hypothetical protein
VPVKHAALVNWVPASGVSFGSDSAAQSDWAVTGVTCCASGSKPESSSVSSTTREIDWLRRILNLRESGQLLGEGEPTSSYRRPDVHGRRSGKRVV